MAASAATAIALLVLMSVSAGAQNRPKSDPGEDLAQIRDDRGTRRAPLLSVGRLQYCLSDLGYYSRTIHGRVTGSTMRALRRFGSDNDIKWRKDALHDFALHGELWAQCRDAWQQNVSDARKKLERSAKRRRAKTLAREAQAEKNNMARLKASRVTLGPRSARASFCLPDELRAVLRRAHGRRGIRTCELPCLLRPQSIARSDAAQYEDKWNIRWCRSCVKFRSYLALADIERIERAGNIRLCAALRGGPRLRVKLTGKVIQSSALSLRRVMNAAGAAAGRHDDIAVLIANTAYQGRLPAKDSALGDLAAMHALLTEKLGYRPDNVIEVRNARRSDFESLFGRRGSPKGRLALKLKARPGANLLIYISGYGGISDADGAPYLLGVDSGGRRTEQAAYRLSTLYDNASRIGARHTSVILEVDFSRSAGAIVLPPNPPLSGISTLPRTARRKLTVLAAARSDQRALVDPVHGCGLFTRHLVEALSGLADAPPLGNGDGVVDSAEAFVFAANKVSLAAAKSFNVMQHPRFSFSKAVVLGRVSSGRGN